MWICSLIIVNNENFQNETSELIFFYCMEFSTLKALKIKNVHMFPFNSKQWKFSKLSLWIDIFLLWNTSVMENKAISAEHLCFFQAESFFEEWVKGNTHFLHTFKIRKKNFILGKFLNITRIMKISPNRNVFISVYEYIIYLSYRRFHLRNP